jgi:signal transduction histidine kinase
VRLATKIVLASSLGIFALAGVAAWNIAMVERLVAVNHRIVTGTAPALHLEASLLASMLNLIRLETRFVVLKDPAYLELWEKRVSGVARDLGALAPLLTSRTQGAAYRQVVSSFQRYRARVGTSESAQYANRTRARLERLTQATDAELKRAQRRSRALEAETRRALLIALPATLVAALLSAGIVSVRVTRDLRRLAQAAAEVADGTFAGSLPIRRRDEIGELAAAFQRMAERLRAIDRSKEDFFAQISHEFRTPLAAMREAAGLLRDRVAGPLEPKQERLVDIVIHSCERSLRLVNQILEIARLRAKLQEIEHHPVRLDRVVTHALDDLRPQAEARGIVLQGSDAVAPVVVAGDEEQLFEVLLNLLGNAIKYTNPGGSVRVALSTQGAHVDVAVADTGSGIAPDALPHVFDRFWQGHGARDGSGLGLAIVRSIVEAHGGKVWAESELGRGSRFTVRLPVEEERA